MVQTKIQSNLRNAQQYFREHLGAFDFTIAPPKCVSVVGLYQDERILALYEQAVRQAMFELEKRAETRVRMLGHNGERRAILLERPELGMGG
jgi:hypothetical protein